MIAAAISPIDITATGIRLGELGPHRAADGYFHTRLHAGVPGLKDTLGDVLGEFAAADVEQDRDEGRLLVLADLRRALLGEGINDARDVWERLHLLVRGLDCLLVLRVGDLPGLRVEDERVAAVLLGREPRREEVRRGLAVGPRQVEVVARVAAEGLRHGGEDGDADDPHGEHDPLPARAEQSQPVQSPGHAA